MDDVFYRALEWIEDQESLVVPTTRVGLVCNAFSHLMDIKSKKEFAIALIRGMGCNLQTTDRPPFAQAVCD